MDPNFHHGPETSLISDVQAIVSLMNFLTAGAAPPWKVTQSSDGVNVTTGNESVDSDAKLGKDSGTLYFKRIGQGLAESANPACAMPSLVLKSTASTSTNKNAIAAPASNSDGVPNQG